MNKEYNNILAIDSATRRLIIGILKDNDRIVKIDEEAETSQSRIIMKRIKNLSESSTCPMSELDAIIIGVGPGSFTGLRIGIAASKAIAVAYNLPLVALSVFELAAYKLKKEVEPVELIVPFKKTEFFSLKITNGSFELNAVKEITLKELLAKDPESNLAAFGIDLDAVSENYFKNNRSDRIQYDASDLIELGKEKLYNNEFADLADLEPLYLKKSEAEINFERRNNQN